MDGIETTSPVKAARVMFCGLLREAYAQAGSPSYRRLCRVLDSSGLLTLATVSRTLAGRTFPQWDIAAAILAALGATLEMIEPWRQCWTRAQAGRMPVEQVELRPVPADALAGLVVGECVACGALVADGDRHRRWHARRDPELIALGLVA
jgi:hypothetical protein